jgi:hypothetical protein
MKAKRATVQAVMPTAAVRRSVPRDAARSSMASFRSWGISASKSRADARRPSPHQKGRRKRW